MKRLRLVLALLVAALFSDIFDRATWRKARAAFKAVFGLMENSEKAPPDDVTQRNAACSLCPFFFKPLRTCGTPLKRDLRDYGCWCNMEYKAESLESTCWGDDEAGENFKWGWNAAGVGMESIKRHLRPTQN